MQPDWAAGVALGKVIVIYWACLKFSVLSTLWPDVMFFGSLSNWNNQLLPDAAMQLLISVKKKLKIVFFCCSFYSEPCTDRKTAPQHDPATAMPHSVYTVCRFESIFKLIQTYICFFFFNKLFGLSKGEVMHLSQAGGFLKLTLLLFLAKTHSNQISVGGDIAFLASAFVKCCLWHFSTNFFSIKWHWGSFRWLEENQVSIKDNAP